MEPAARPLKTSFRICEAGETDNEVCTVNPVVGSTYGVRRIRAALGFERGLVANMKLIRRIMAEQGTCGLPRLRNGRRNLVNVATSEGVP